MNSILCLFSLLGLLLLGNVFSCIQFYSIISFIRYDNVVKVYADRVSYKLPTSAPIRVSIGLSPFNHTVHIISLSKTCEQF